jgi:hypothetical protein
MYSAKKVKKNDRKNNLKHLQAFISISARTRKQQDAPKDVIDF